MKEHGGEAGEGQEKREKYCHKDYHKEIVCALLLCLDMQEQFERDYAAVQRRQMTTNYRSTASIVSGSNALIAGNYRNPDRAGHLPKALTAAPGTTDNDPVQFVRYRSKDSQGQHILEMVKWWHQHGMCTGGLGVHPFCTLDCHSSIHPFIHPSIHPCLFHGVMKHMRLTVPCLAVVHPLIPLFSGGVSEQWMP